MSYPGMGYSIPDTYTPYGSPYDIGWDEDWDEDDEPEEDDEDDSDGLKTPRNKRNG